MVTRREFLAAIGAAPAAFSVRLKPDTTNTTHIVSGNITHVGPGFKTVRQPQNASLRFGYAAITWGSALTQAMDDIAAVGFRGIQLRGEAFAQYGDKPAALRDALARHRLTFAVLSSGNLSIDPAREREELETHVRHAQFVKDAGGEYLQVIDERPKDRAIVLDDYRRLGRLMSELGKRTADLGVPLVYHHHMNSLGEKPEEVDAVLDAADKKYVRVLFDVAHYQQGGGDPAAAMRKYKEWIEVLHLKDVRPAPPAAPQSSIVPVRPGQAVAATPTYQFVELGRGRVNMAGVFAAMRDIDFAGWAIVELDRVPDAGRTPKESAEINKRFLLDRGFRL
jgi:inosose dehydratase